MAAPHIPRFDSQDFKDLLPIKILYLLFVWPILCTTIAIDRYVFTKRNPFLSIPRNTEEIRRDKKRFFALLQSPKVRRGGPNGTEPLIPPRAIMVYVDVKEGTRAEPFKNMGVACVDVAFRMPIGAAADVRGACIAPPLKEAEMQKGSTSASHQRNSVADPSQPLPIADTTDPAAVRAAVEHYARYTTTATLEDGTEATVTVLRLFVKMTTHRMWPVFFKALIATVSTSIKEVSVFAHFIPMLQDYYGGKWNGTTSNVDGGGGCTVMEDSGDGAPAKEDATSVPEATAASGKATTTRRSASASASSSSSPPLPPPPAFPLNGACPFTVPTCHYTSWSRIFDRSFTVFDCVDTTIWRGVPDHCVVTEAHVLALVGNMAKMHAATVGRVGHYASRYHRDMLAMSPNDARVYEAVSRWSPERTATAWLQAMLNAFEHAMTSSTAAPKYAKRRHGNADVTVDGPDLTPAQFEALDDGVWFHRLWLALAHRLEKTVTAVSHCDCRAGNSLISGGGGGKPPCCPSARPPQDYGHDAHPRHTTVVGAHPITSTPEEDDDNAAQYSKATAGVILLDYEACAMAPLLYDIAYTIAGRPERTRYETVVLSHYLQSLEAAVEDRLDRDGVTDPSKRATVLARCVPSLAKAQDGVKIMYLVQGYFAWVIGKFGGVGATQGNSREDLVHWAARGRCAIGSATADPEAMARLINTLEDGTVVTDTKKAVSANDIRLFRFKMTQCAEEFLETGKLA